MRFLGFFYFPIFWIMSIHLFNCETEVGHLEAALEKERKQNFTQAMHRYDLALKENPKNRTALKRLGILLSRNPESWGVAISHLEKALTLDPLDEEIRRHLFFMGVAINNKNIVNQHLIYWKTTNQLKIHEDMEAIYKCEIIDNNYYKKKYRQAVETSPIIPDFWKKRCLGEESKN